MNMKECCKTITEGLADVITDSFYDDTDGGYVEIYIDNPNNDEIMLQFILNGDEFGVLYRDYSRFFRYDDKAAENVDKLIKFVRGIMSDKLCMLTVYKDGDGWAGDIIIDTRKITPELIGKFISDHAGNSDSGYVELVRWSKSGYDTRSYKNGAL